MKEVMPKVIDKTELENGVSQIFQHFLQFFRYQDSNGKKKIRHFSIERPSSTLQAQNY